MALSSEVFALELFGHNLPLILIAIMTFVLITSSGTMALAVRYAHFRDKQKIFWFMVITASVRCHLCWDAGIRVV